MFGCSPFGNAEFEVGGILDNTLLSGMLENLPEIDRSRLLNAYKGRSSLRAQNVNEKIANKNLKR
jgi:hypothetical protein